MELYLFLQSAYIHIFIYYVTPHLKNNLLRNRVSKSLGLTQLQSFTKIALPLARPAIFGGLTLVIMETLAEFGTMDYYGVQHLLQAFIEHGLLLAMNLVLYTSHLFSLHSCLY